LFDVIILKSTKHRHFPVHPTLWRFIRGHDAS
jgi:hypothetical protein